MNKSMNCVKRLFSTADVARLRVVMDLDECMIHSPDRHKITTTGVHSVEIKCENGLYVVVHHRPGVVDFLANLREFADVYVFTAALPSYARPVLKTLDPHNNIFKKSWYRDSCSKMLKIESGQTGYSKNLEVLQNEYNAERTLLVDNSILSHAINPTNGILVSSFCDDPNDRELDDVMALLKNLNTVKDVRPVLSELFDLTSKVNELMIRERIIKKY